MYNDLELQYPTTIITDADGGLTTALSVTFPATKHLYCIWHINKACMKYIKEYLADIGDLASMTWEEQRTYTNGHWNNFWSYLQSIIYAETLEKYKLAWQRLYEKYDAHTELIAYLWTVWFDDHAEKIVRAYSNLILHVGNHTTSRTEGMHAVLKEDLASSMCDLKIVIEKLEKLLKHQNFEITVQAVKERTKLHHQHAGLLLSGACHVLSVMP